MAWLVASATVALCGSTLIWHFGGRAFVEGWFGAPRTSSSNASLKPVSHAVEASNETVRAAPVESTYDEYDDRVTPARSTTDATSELSYPYKGRVINFKGEPVPGACVSTPKIPYCRNDELTGADGRFEQSRVRGESDLVARHPEYSDSLPIHASAGEEPVELVLRELGTISGRVADAQTGASLTAFRVMSQYSGEYYTKPEMVRGARGEFTLNKVKSGTRSLMVLAHGYVTEYIAMAPLAPAERRRVNDIRLEPAVQVEGHVVDASGRPVEAAKIEARPIRNGQYGATTSDRSNDDGRFLLTGLPAGAVRIFASHEGLVPAKIDLNVTRDIADDVRIVLPRGATIEGTVTTGLGITSRVYARTNDQTFGNSPIDQFGHYKISGVPDGEIELSIVWSNDELSEDKKRWITLQTWTAVRTFRVAGEREKRVDINVRRPDGAIDGTVWAEPGIPISSEAHVNAFLETDSDTTLVVNTSVDGKGHFRLRVPAGRGRLSVWGKKDVKDAYARFEVSAKEELRKDLVCYGGAVLDVTVHNAPRPDRVGVTVLEGEIDRSTFSASDRELSGWRRAGSAFVKLDGRGKTRGGLEPGKYTVVATCAENGDAEPPRVVWDAKPVEVKSDGEVAVSLDLGARR